MAKARKDEKVDNYNSHFPKLLRQLMEENQVTQQNLAESVNVSRQAISQYINGSTNPDIYTFTKIVEYFREKKRN